MRVFKQQRKGEQCKANSNQGGTTCMDKERPIAQRGDDPDSPNGAVMTPIGPSNIHNFESGPIMEVDLSNHTITISPQTPKNSPTQPVTPITPPLSPKKSRDIQINEAGQDIELGLTNHTLATKSIHLIDNPTHQKEEKEREWKVYVRSKGCKQKEAHQIKKHKFLDDFNPPPHHQPISGVSTPPNESGYQYMDIHSTNQGMQNNPGLSSIVEGPNEDHIKEASSQWKLAKIMGVYSDSDHATIINKITAMEVRDRQ